MSVLIKGMRMPTDCGECVLCDAVKDDEYDYEINIYCHATGESLESLDVRGDRCPLTSVPTPHGGLIDQSMIINELRELKTNDKDSVYEYYDDGLDMAISELSIFPIIIEAEEGEEA